jgi:hypothetical protein
MEKNLQILSLVAALAIPPFYLLGNYQHTETVLSCIRPLAYLSIFSNLIFAIKEVIVSNRLITAKSVLHEVGVAVAVASLLPLPR